MKKKFLTLSAAGLAMFALMSLKNTNDSTVNGSTELLADDWIVVGTPYSYMENQSYFTPGQSSLSVGDGTWATAPSSLAVGSEVKVNGYVNMAFGYETVCDGFVSFALGGATSTYGNCSGAMGYGVASRGTSMFVIGSLNDLGSYNPATDDATLDIFEKHPDGHLFVIGNGEDGMGSSNALVTKWNGETTLKNKYWDSANPNDDSTTDPYGTGEALVVDGHTVLNGKVIISEPQGDISMGIYGGTSQ